MFATLIFPLKYDPEKCVRAPVSPAKCSIEPLSGKPKKAPGKSTVSPSVSPHFASTVIFNSLSCFSKSASIFGPQEGFVDKTLWELTLGGKCFAHYSHGFCWRWKKRSADLVSAPSKK